MSSGRELKRIALLVDTRQVWGREVYTGVSRYAREHARWSMVHQPASPDDPPRWFGRERFDGVLGRVRTDEVLRAVRELACPVVNLYTNLAGHPFPVVQFDDDAIGTLAAQHLLGCGFERFGYVGGPYLWAARRQRAFERTLGDRGHRARAFVLPDVLDMSTTLAEIDGWLEALPKPAAIFACNDLFASQVLNVARGLELEVPEDVAVLGVDNDISLCCATEIELSSLRVDPQVLGYRAAQLLDTLFRGESAPSHVTMLEPDGVVTRHSTDVVAGSNDPHLTRALRFIRDRACDAIDVEDVARAAALSRSALQRRFRTALRRSIRGEIERVRVERAKRLLTDTELPIAVVADQVGISPQSYLNTVFKARVGLTPATFRAKMRAHRL